MTTIGFARVSKNSLNSMRQAISEALKLIDYSFNNNTKSVVIKPNMCYYWDYSTGQTTDPRFVAALIDLIRRKISPEPNISIVESDASAMKCTHVFRMLGYERLSKDYGVELVNLTKDKSETVETTVGDLRLNVSLPQTIANASLKLNIPKIKYTMEPIKITCALKNIFGCNPYPRKFRYHPKLEEAIVAINKIMRFDLSIIDGNIVSGIQPCRIGLVMASRDPVAIDTAASKIAGVNPRTIRYLQIASNEGLGKTSFTPKGVPISYFKSLYPRKTINKKLMNKAYSLLTYTGLGRKIGLE